MNGRILITGGTGSLGHALLDRAHHEKWDAEIVVYSRDEVKQGLTREVYPNARYVLGDVRDVDTLEGAMRGAAFVIHAAAYKRVPEAEENAAVTVQTNVIGSLNVVRLATKLGVQAVVGVSSDKASAPVTAYGQTKALMERIFQSADGPTHFSLVRYGNVLGSRGSVVPLFRDLVARGNPIPVTDPRMTRFWITLPQAVNLIMSSFTAQPRTVLVPKIEGSTMAVLVEALAGPDYPTVITGIRPAEKIHEHLVNSSEARYTSETEGHYHIGWAAAGRPRDGKALPDGFEFRSDTTRQMSASDLKALLRYA